MTAIQLLDDPDGYRAGACNIGPAEIARRRRSGVLGLAGAALLAVLLLAVDAAPVARLTVALPLFIGILGFAQARLRFCVGFGMAGLRNFGPLGDPERVAGSADHRADVRRSLTVGIACGIGAGALSVLFAALPI